MGNSHAEDFEIELFSAFEACGLNSFQPENKDELLDRIQDKFVKGNPRACWDSLKFNYSVYKYEDYSGYLHINELAPNLTKNVWFVVDEDNVKKFLFDVPINAIPEVIKECRFFEYYVVSHDLTWLLSETDHGAIIVANNTK